MKKIIAGISVFALLAFAFPVGADEATVSATVTPKLIAITIDDGDIAYGTLDLSPSSGSPITQDTVTLNDTQVIQNVGTVNQDYAVKSSDATGGTTLWELVAAASISTDAFGHQYSTDGSSFTDFPSSNGYTTDIITAKTPLSYADLDAKIFMPTASTDASDTKTIEVTVLATES